MTPIVSPDEIDAQRTEQVYSNSSFSNTFTPTPQAGITINNSAPITTDQEASDLFARAKRV